jgi:hypothetical protein
MADDLRVPLMICRTIMLAVVVIFGFATYAVHARLERDIACVQAGGSVSNGQDTWTCERASK